MARIAGVDLPNNKRGEIGLTYIFGIGRSSARKILSQLGIDFDTSVAALRGRSSPSWVSILTRRSETGTTSRSQVSVM